MKISGSISPSPLLFEHRFDGTAEMRFRENISKNDDGSFTYDEYLLSMQDRAGLEKIVTDNLPVWLAYAKAQETEQLAADARTQRDKLLSDTDWTQVDDAPISDADRESMRQYRQTLRDIPSLESFPYNINFPNKPNLKTVGNQSVKTQKDEQISILCQQITALVLKGGETVS